MRPSRRTNGRVFALALACAVGACGGAEPVSAQRIIDPTPASFSTTNLDVDRPCTLLTGSDAADISGMPFYRTMAANLVEDGHIRCAQGVGAYGLHGVVEVDMQVAADGAVAAEAFRRECRAMSIASAESPMPPPQVAFHENEAHMDPAVLVAAPIAPTPVPAINGDHCVQAGGAYALLLSDRVLVLRVRESAGEIDGPATRRLASLVSYRLTSN
jgi:hypothetical protein